MPDSFELVLWGIVMAVLWLRGMTAAKRKREQATLDAVRDEPEVEEGRPAPAKRLSMREQWREMAQQVERRMQEAQAEGRPGSLVAHVGEDDEEDDEERMVFVPGRPVAPSQAPEAVSLPVPRPETSVTVRREPAAAAITREPVGGGTRGAAGRGRDRVSTRLPTRGGPSGGADVGSDLLDRLDRYSPLARAVILSEILGTPPGLKGDPWDERWDSPD